MCPVLQAQLRIWMSKCTIYSFKFCYNIYKIKRLVINSCHTVTMYLRVQGIASSLPSDDLKYPGLHDGHTADASSVVLLNMGYG